MERTLKITQINDKYVVESPSGRVNILNLKSLKWNLKHVFGLTGQDVLAIVVSLSDDGVTNHTVEINLEAA